jgi:tetratricopeptide (TPR) repeat protein
MSLSRSRLLARLDAELAATQEQHSLDIAAHRVRAQRAMVLVRQGDLEMARQDLTALHQAAFASPHPELAAWLHLAEGLMAYYTNFSDSSQERLQRALNIARSCGCLTAQAQAHGYLAMQGFASEDMTRVVSHVHEGLLVAEPDDSLARGRLCLVGGFSLHYAGEAEAATRWYAKARQHGSRLGDDALLSALMHNAAQMRVAHVRQAELQGRMAELAGLLPGVESAINFDSAMGINALEVLNPLLRGQVLVCTGDFSGALKLFEQYLPMALARGLERMGSSLLADTAWCRAHLGQTDAALAQARESELELDPSSHADDRAVAHARLSQLFHFLNLPQDAARHHEAAQAAWAAHAGFQRQVKEGLLGLTPA